MPDNLKKKREELKNSLKLAFMCDALTVTDEELDRAVEQVDFNLSPQNIMAKARQRAAIENRNYDDVLNEEIVAAVTADQTK